MGIYSSSVNLSVGSCKKVIGKEDIRSLKDKSKQKIIRNILTQIRELDILEKYNSYRNLTKPLLVRYRKLLNDIIVNSEHIFPKNWGKKKNYIAFRKMILSNKKYFKGKRLAQQMLIDYRRCIREFVRDMSWKYCDLSWEYHGVKADRTNLLKIIKNAPIKFHDSMWQR